MTEKKRVREGESCRQNAKKFEQRKKIENFGKKVCLKKRKQQKLRSKKQQKNR